MSNLTDQERRAVENARIGSSRGEDVLLAIIDRLVDDAPAVVPLRRCTRCGERVRVEGETVLCDGVVSKLAPLSVHVSVTPTILGYPVRFVDQPATVHLLIISKHTGEPIGCMHNPSDDAVRHAQKEDPGCTFREVQRSECPVCQTEEED